MAREVIEILDEEEEEDREPGDIDRRAALTPIITRVVNALGGLEGDTYELGDEAYGCLKDLKKLWRKDDTDDDRTVARIFWATRVLPNDLVPLLLATAGQGAFDDRRAIACADLATAMTWPIDLAEELKELDDDLLLSPMDVFERTLWAQLPERRRTRRKARVEREQEQERRVALQRRPPSDVPRNAQSSAFSIYSDDDVSAHPYGRAAASDELP